MLQPSEVVISQSSRRKRKGPIRSLKVRKANSTPATAVSVKTKASSYSSSMFVAPVVEITQGHTLAGEAQA